MIFHSWQFAIFLILTLAGWWLLSPYRLVRNAFLLSASCFFYGVFEPWFTWLLVGSTLLDYSVGLGLAHATSLRKRRLLLAASLAGNLGLLAYFKYTYWLTGLIDPLLADCGLDFRLRPYAWDKIVPVGISFYTFQTLSYSIDVFRGTLRARSSLSEFALFVTFFPQLVAGPIVRAADFLPQLDHRPRVTAADLREGFWRILIGLLKKALLADVIGSALVDPVYVRPGDYGPLVHLVVLYAFCFQIYCDFSGYSDIAVGCARLFGFRIMENFDAPYRSRSVREFWRRWHISLSSWVRDYVYFPLGGSRGSEWRVAFNLYVTMITIGLWHGASELWLLYGIMQASAMTLERWLERRRGGAPFATSRWTSAIAWILTFHFGALTLLCVRGSTLSQVVDMLTVFGDAGFEALEPWGLVALAVAIFTHFEPDKLSGRVHGLFMRLPFVVVGLALGIVAGLLFLLMVRETPFIYFQF